jgi:hypothetical protein
MRAYANEWVPETGEIPDYLLEVRDLLVETTGKVLAKRLWRPSISSFIDASFLRPAGRRVAGGNLLKAGQSLRHLRRAPATSV